METTFITIHDLSDEALILYASDSIVDILGYTPDEVVNRASWDFFHAEDLPVARKLHDRSVNLDKASVLSYCRLQNRQGEWVTCECCFTVVYNVMVACTSIYQQGLSGERRRIEAPAVRRLFASSPKDPRYHMLTHLSAKFQQDPGNQSHEPRAALFLNRFTRTLTIMYATSGIEDIVGISSEDMKGRSFYFCIAESCLEDAVRCLESAKGNDSIAYLRFMFRDPRIEDVSSQEPSDDSDALMTDVETDTGVSESEPESTSAGAAFGQTSSSEQVNTSGATTQSPPEGIPSGTSSHQNSSDSVPQLSTSDSNMSTFQAPSTTPMELEAVVSCTSDGMVVILRRARPAVPEAYQQDAIVPVQDTVPYTTGFFAAPWGRNPTFAPFMPPAHPAIPVGPGLAPQLDIVDSAGGPKSQDFMNSIREVAVFAWGLTGINGTLVDYTRGNPTGEAQPADGLPIWDPSFTGDESSSGRGSASSGGKTSPVPEVQAH